MKKYLSLLLILAMMLSSIIFSSLTTFAEPEEGENANKVDAVNSGFEGVTDVKSTSWYKLVDTNGNSKPNEKIYENISIKTDGGHTGDNYLSMSADKGWYSPSINIYPFIKDAGPGVYIISFWYRMDITHALKDYLLIRGLESDAYPDPDEYYPDIQAKADGNFYANVPGSIEDLGSPWKYYVSEPFEVVQEQFDGDHNWWFCMDNFPNSAFVFDIDDFSIINEDDFEGPPEVEVPDTDLTYITDDVEANIFPAVTPGSANNADNNNANNITKTPNSATDANSGLSSNETAGLSTTTVIIIAAAAFIVAGVAAAAITIIIKKKKSAE